MAALAAAAAVLVIAAPLLRCRPAGRAGRREPAGERGHGGHVRENPREEHQPQHPELPGRARIPGRRAQLAHGLLGGLARRVSGDQPAASGPDRGARQQRRPRRTARPAGRPRQPGCCPAGRSRSAGAAARRSARVAGAAARRSARVAGAAALAVIAVMSSLAVAQQAPAADPRPGSLIGLAAQRIERALPPQPIALWVSNDQRPALGQLTLGQLTLGIVWALTASGYHPELLSHRAARELGPASATAGSGSRWRRCACGVPVWLCGSGRSPSRDSLVSGQALGRHLGPSAPPGDQLARHRRTRGALARCPAGRPVAHGGSLCRPFALP